MARPKPSPDKQLTPRSFRCSAEVWDRVKERAAEEDTTASAAVAELVEGFAKGVYDLPRITKVFPGGR